MKTFYLVGNFCERRVLDREAVYNYLLINSFEPVSTLGNAEIIVFVSCGMCEEESRMIIHDAVLAKKEAAKLVVFGCFSSMCPPLLKTNVFYIPLNCSHQLDQLINARIPYKEIEYPRFVKNSLLQADFNFWDPRILLPHCSNVYSVIVSEGCALRCSYCAIRKATGALRSRTINEIVSDFKRGLSLGYKNFRVQCENLGVYGKDIGENLGTLLIAIAQIEEEFYVDLPDLYPLAFLNYFEEIESFVNRKKVYLVHLPVQSASQRILRLMRRNYNIDKVKANLAKFKVEHPEIRLGTDIIVGFPTETEEEFMQSYQFMKDFGFDWIYLHAFGLKPDTPAERLMPQIPWEVILERITLAYKTVPNVICLLNNYALGEKPWL